WGRHIGTHTTGGLTRSKGLLVTGEHVRVLFLHLLVVLDGLFGHPFLLQEVDELGPGVRDELANLPAHVRVHKGLDRVRPGLELFERGVELLPFLDGLADLVDGAHAAGGLARGHRHLRPAGGFGLLGPLAVLPHLKGHHLLDGHSFGYLWRGSRVHYRNHRSWRGNRHGGRRDDRDRRKLHRDCFGWLSDYGFDHVHPLGFSLRIRRTAPNVSPHATLVPHLGQASLVRSSTAPHASPLSFSSGQVKYALSGISGAAGAGGFLTANPLVTAASRSVSLVTSGSKRESTAALTCSAMEASSPVFRAFVCVSMNLHSSPEQVLRTVSSSVSRSFSRSNSVLGGMFPLLENPVRQWVILISNYFWRGVVHDGHAALSDRRNGQKFVVNRALAVLLFPQLREHPISHLPPPFLGAFP